MCFTIDGAAFLGGFDRCEYYRVNDCTSVGKSRATWRQWI